MNAKRQYKVPAEEISIFCEQIRLILSAGMPLHDGVEAVSENYRTSREAGSFQEIARQVTETGSLYHALEASGIFPRYMVEMTRIGEKTGKLEQVMKGLGDYYMRESKVRAAIVNAVTYPLVLMAMMAAIIAVLIVKVLPIFEQALQSIGLDMGGSANQMMRFGMTAGRVVLVIVSALIVLILVVGVLLRTKLSRKVMEIIIKAFPPIGKIYAKLAASRFSAVMAMMMSSGFPMEEALEMMPSIISDDAAREKVEEISRNMDEGMSFPDALDKSALFEELHSRMVHMGYMAGQVDEVMHKVADIYEEEVDDGIARMISIIEPSLVALLSIVIGAILLSVMLPMASIISSIV